MGNEHSNNRNYQQPAPPPMSEAQMQRLLEAQRVQYERKLEEVAARQTAQRKREEAAKEAESKLEKAAKAAAQRLQQEDAARASAQNSTHMPQMNPGMPPYTYLNQHLQQGAPSAPPAPQPLFNNVYPNLNQTPSSPNYGTPPLNNPLMPHTHTQNRDLANNNNPFVPRTQNQDFVFVNRFGQAESYNRPMPPRGPCAAPGPRGPAARGASRGGGPRHRSQSRTRNASSERDAFNCPTCNSRYGARIFTCDEGHSSCNDCKTRGRTCGLCGRHITDRRSYDVEKLIAQTKAPCPHASEGCKLTIKIEDMDTHVKECPFKEQDCPLNAVFGTCRWKGKLSQLSTHFDNAHPNGRQTNVDSEMRLTNVRSSSQEVHLVCLGVYNFLVHVKVSEPAGKVYMAVQLIGTKFSAMKWTYEIHVYNKSESRRKYLYTDNCCSSNDKIDDVFNAGGCAVLPVAFADTFVCDGVFTYKFFIKKTNEDKKAFVKNPRGRGKNH